MVRTIIKRATLAASLAAALCASAVIGAALFVPLPVLAQSGFFQLPYAGAIARTVNAKLSDFVNGTDAGMRCNGSTDDSTAMVLAGTIAVSLGHGNVQLPAGPCAIGGSADVTLPAGATYIGSKSAFGYHSNFSTAPFTLLLNASHKIVMSDRSGLYGVRIYPQGLGANATTLRAALTQIGNFSGTAISINAIKDVTLEYVTINGFSTAIQHRNSDRVHYSYVSGDDTTFLDLDGCGDTCTLNKMEAWPFLASPYALNPQWETTAVSAFSNSGGLVRVTLASTPTFPIQTGDIIVVGHCATYPNCTSPQYQAPNGRWIATRVDDTNFTLQGSDYSGLCPAGCSATNEAVFLTASTRTGPAFSFKNTGAVAFGLVDYGHDIGVLYGTGTDGMQCVGCWLDGDTATGMYADSTPVGVVNGGAVGNSAVLTQHNAFTGGKILDKAISVYNNSTSPRPLLLDNTLLSSVGVWANVNGSAIHVASGSVVGSNLSVEGALSGNVYALDSGSTLLQIDNLRSEGGGAYYETSAECAKFLLNGEEYCTWTPSLAGDSVAGTDTANIAVGSYLKFKDKITAWGIINSTGLSGASGNLVIKGLPYANDGASNSYGACSFGRISGIAFDPGYGQLLGSIAPSATQIAVNQGGSGTNLAVTGLPASSANVGAIAGSGTGTQLQFVCTYHQ